MSRIKYVWHVVQARLFNRVEPSDAPWRFAESEFELLARASGSRWERVRRVLEAWYSAYDDRDGDLRARFQQHDYRQHDSAWWELYIYTLFRLLGYTVEVHPILKGSSNRPDLFATRGDSGFYIECVTLFDSADHAREDSEAFIKDCINATTSPDFGFSLRINRAGSRRPKGARIKRDIESWVSRLDYDSERDAGRAGHAARQSRTFDFADWRVTLTALPFPPERRGNDGPRILIGPASGGFLDTTVDRIRKLLSKKASQCRAVQQPLVVAILGRAMFARTNEVDQALFGSEAVSYSRHETDVAELVRQQNGFWHPGPSARGAHVSAVLFSEKLHPAFVTAELPMLWKNPWATKPLVDTEPFATRTANNSGEVYSATSSSISPNALFDLPTGWPDFE